MLFQLVQMIKDNTWTFGTNILLIHTGGTQGIAGYNYQYQAQWPEH
jgi:1-aminocyclopropane-1-carboxylate deaminase/D-cysteine desulfhydrase-like pyridoxal-dependent ACC family enzyme